VKELLRHYPSDSSTGVRTQARRLTWEARDFFCRGTSSSDGSRPGVRGWAEVHGEWYGTLRSQTELILQSGRNVLLDIDVQGRSIRKIYPNGFIRAPPSLADLEAAASQGTDSEERIRLRLENARREVALSEYDYAVVNDDLKPRREGGRHH
jgi:guanylate kinase